MRTLVLTLASTLASNFSVNPGINPGINLGVHLVLVMTWSLKLEVHFWSVGDNREFNV